ncbi:hypothetical protein DRN72_03250 [Methanosarcinales archaeon]|nr:MAG: hypothetical protein DRN72_03250 [Methanosarcinales archaeon]
MVKVSGTLIQILIQIQILIPPSPQCRSQLCKSKSLVMSFIPMRLFLANKQPNNQADVKVFMV